MTLDVLPQQLNADSPLWAWAYDGIHHRAEGMLEHLEGVREGKDIEAVHDMRVGSRRLVAAMRVFRECFPGRHYERLLREGRQVTRRLGAVRDLDVLIDYFERRQSTEAIAPALEYCVAVLKEDRKEARKPMLKAMDQLEQGDFIGRLGTFIRQEAETYAVGLAPCSDGLGCGRPFRAAAPPALEERLKELYSFLPYVHNPEAVEELHEMRIAAKWFRYTMELFSPAYGDALKPQISSVKKIQELLGDLHDADVRLDLTQQMLEHPAKRKRLKKLGVHHPGAVTESLAALHTAEEQVRRNCYEAFHQEWNRLENAHFRKECTARIANADG